MIPLLREKPAYRIYNSTGNPHDDQPGRGRYCEPMIDEKFAEVPAMKDAALDKIPLGRLGKPEEVAGLVLFLCSDAASYITCKGIVIAGGLGIRS